VEKSQGAPLDLEIRRGDRTFHLEVRPSKWASRMVSRNGRSVWVFKSVRWFDRRLPFGAAIAESVAMNTLMARQVAFVVSNCFAATFRSSSSEGPLGHRAESGRAARQGASELLKLMAMIGVNLAILNLLPIPPLDGGTSYFSSSKDRFAADLSIRVKERFVTVSMVFLLLGVCNRLCTMTFAAGAPLMRAP